MKKPLTIALLAAAMASIAPCAVLAGGEGEPFNAAAADITPYYERGPRIIHVPQPGEPDERTMSRASVGGRDAPSASNEDDEVVAPKPRRQVKPQRRTDLPPARKPYSAPPPPAGPRRAVLSAPPPRAGGIYPTPRYDEKPAAGEKFVPPPDPAVTADAPAAD